MMLIPDPVTPLGTTGPEEIPCPDCVGGVLVLRWSPEFSSYFYGCNQWFENGCRGTMRASRDGSPYGVPGDANTRKLRQEVFALFEGKIRSPFVDLYDCRVWMRSQLRLSDKYYICHLTAEQCQHLLGGAKGETPGKLSLDDYIYASSLTVERDFHSHETVDQLQARKQRGRDLQKKHQGNIEHGYLERWLQDAGVMVPEKASIGVLRRLHREARRVIEAERLRLFRIEQEKNRIAMASERRERNIAEAENRKQRRIERAKGLRPKDVSEAQWAVLTTLPAHMGWEQWEERKARYVYWVRERAARPDGKKKSRGQHRVEQLRFAGFPVDGDLPLPALDVLYEKHQARQHLSWCFSRRREDAEVEAQLRIDAMGTDEDPGDAPIASDR